MTQMQIAFSTSKAVRQRREGKKAEIREWFLKHLGVPQGTTLMHQIFGTAFRSRVSEMNRDPKERLTIRNVTTAAADGVERSIWVSEIRGWKETIQ